MSKQNFITKFREMWGDLYDYSKFVCASSRDKGVIICREHGEFLKSPNKHTRKDSPQGCPKCALRRRSVKKRTNSQILEVFRGVHGDRFQYIFPEDTLGVDDKVTVICKEHGEFNQRVLNHINGKSCGLCAGGVPIPHSEFLKRVRNKHGDKYDYSGFVNYKGLNDKQLIFCKACNEASIQRLIDHLKGCGCYKCGKKKGGKQTLTKDNFIIVSNSVHNYRYDYSKVVYKNRSSIICITCTEHGDFYQRAKNHVRGDGCPHCHSVSVFSKSLYVKHSKAKYNGKIFLYFIGCYNSQERFYKVGVTMVGTKKRFQGKSCMPYNFEVIKELQLEATVAVDKETKFHRLLKEYHYIPDIPFGGHLQECFSEKGFDKAKEMFDNLKLEILRGNYAHC